MENNSHESIKEQIMDFAARYGKVLAFREDLQNSKNSLLIPWSDGTSTRWTVEAEPLMVEDSTKIKVNYNLKATKGKGL